VFPAAVASRELVACDEGFVVSVNSVAPGSAAVAGALARDR
jgi:hypothetical protein